jgi:hypothetical protein
MAVKIQNENDHENEHDWRGQTLARRSNHVSSKKFPEAKALEDKG